MKWAGFWARSAAHDNRGLDDTQKLTYLREAIKDTEVTPLLYRATESEDQYRELVSILKDRYDQRRLIHRTYTMSIINAPVIKQGNYTELCSFIDNLEHNLSCSFIDNLEHNLSSLTHSCQPS